MLSECIFLAGYAERYLNQLGELGVWLFDAQLSEAAEDDLYLVVPELGDLREVVHGCEQFNDGAEGGSVWLLNGLRDGLVEVVDFGRVQGDVLA